MTGAAQPLGAGQALLPRARTHVPNYLSLVILLVMPCVFWPIPLVSKCLFLLVIVRPCKSQLSRCLAPAPP